VELKVSQAQAQAQAQAHNGIVDDAWQRDGALPGHHACVTSDTVFQSEYCMAYIIPEFKELFVTFHTFGILLREPHLLIDDGTADHGNR